MVSDSVVVFAVRKGNPEGIRTWDDLTREGIEVITPNPFTSGGAQWNVMAAYGAQRALGKSERERVEYLRSLFRNVSVQDKSAREALQTFVGGKGDVLLAYENEAILAQSKGEELDYVVPDETILIENPIAVVGEGGHADAGAALRRVHAEPRGPARLRQGGLPPDPEGRSRRVRLPDAGEALHDRATSAAGPPSASVLRRRGRRHGRDPARAGAVAR